MKPGITLCNAKKLDKCKLEPMFKRTNKIGKKLQSFYLPVKKSNIELLESGQMPVFHLSNRAASIVAKNLARTKEHAERRQRRAENLKPLPVINTKKDP